MGGFLPLNLKEFVLGSCKTYYLFHKIFSFIFLLLVPISLEGDVWVRNAGG